MFAIWRSVISSPLGTFSTYRSIVSSSERSPSAAAWRSRLTVKVLVTLPIRWCMSADIGSSEERSATPRVPTHVSSGVWTAAVTPGARSLRRTAPRPRLEHPGTKEHPRTLAPLLLAPLLGRHPRHNHWPAEALTQPRKAPLTIIANRHN